MRARPLAVSIVPGHGVVTAEWDDKWGKEFIKPDQLVEFVYAALKPAKK